MGAIKLSISISSNDYEWLRNAYGPSLSEAVQNLIQDTRDRYARDLSLMAKECGR